eukprot:2517733-Rhodomonas_salina.1
MFCSCGEWTGWDCHCRHAIAVAQDQRFRILPGRHKKWLEKGSGFKFHVCTWTAFFTKRFVPLFPSLADLKRDSPCSELQAPAYKVQMGPRRKLRIGGGKANVR